MSLTDNTAAMDAAVKAWRDSGGHYTLMDIRQGPGEGNYDRVERLRLEDTIRAAEEARKADAPTIEFLSFDEDDTLVLQAPDDERKTMDRYEALKHAVKAHGRTLDKGGLLYVLHPMAVADRVEQHWNDLPDISTFGTLVGEGDLGGISVESGIIVALLHDVLEDTEYPLPPNYFTTQQWAALQLVTHDPRDTYFEYIEQIAGNSLATVVKLADLSHNLSPERAAALDERSRKGLEKRYLKARGILWDALRSEWWPA